MSQKYETLYAEHRHALGDPFPEVREYFEALHAPKSVLDLGAGQGRDAIFIAKLGHRVHAVDLSPTGLAQLAEDCAGLEVTTELADIREFASDQQFDVILIDRTLHMIGADAGARVITGLQGNLAAGSEIYVLDEKSNIPAFVKAARALGLELVMENARSFIAKRA